MLKYAAWLVAASSVGYGVLLSFSLLKEPDLPPLDLGRWWGGTRPAQEDTAIRPFRIEFNDTMIADLKRRVQTRRPLTPPLEGIQSEYGMNTNYLNKVLSYWVEKYDFKKRAELLNQFPHYKTSIQGLDIHFIHVKPAVKAASRVLPLLALHGWPSSSKEFDKLIPMLTNPKKGYDFVFEVIAADLPGFGFSEGSSKAGLNTVQMGIIMRNLMKRLGFDQFYVQAGGMGAQAATHMATVFPNEVLGFHTNAPLSTTFISIVKWLLGSLAPSLFGEHSHRIYPLKKASIYILRESGYLHIQSTKPDTIGVALTDSPSGLAAYYMEKMAVGSNRDQLDTAHGGLDNLQLDDVLDTVTIQWLNNCAVTSSRVYIEDHFVSSPEVYTVHQIPTRVPTAAIKFLYEIFWQPDWILRDKFPNLVHSTTIDFGGHYASLESPRVLADDIFAATVEFLKFNEGKNGD